MNSAVPFTPFDHRAITGAFDIVGDVHGCAEELIALLQQLGYRVALGGEGIARIAQIEPPTGRKLVFVGDFVDRGPSSPDALRLAMSACASGFGFAVAGNHDVKCVRMLRGNRVSLSHGLELTKAQLDVQPEVFRADVEAFLNALPSYLWLDGGQLVIAHAGIRADMIGTHSNAVRSFCLYGDTDGTSPTDGLPIRYNWAARYDGKPFVVYGHTVVNEPTFQNNTVCIDTGCCFGGALSAFRWPERETVRVKATAMHARPSRPFVLPPIRPNA